MSRRSWRSRFAPTRRLVRGLALIFLIVPLAAFDSIEALFAPSSDLWPRWQAHDPASDKVIDHGAWSALIADHSQLDSGGIRQVDYAALAGPARQALDGYLAKLVALPISSYNRDEQFAYWANLYNALTAQVVADHWPVESIRDIDISPGWFSDGPWDAELIEVEGEKLSLNDIEHRILRPIWRDPRVHYAVNCAAVGCPNLAAQAFNGAELDQQLEVASKAFVNDPRAIAFDGDGVILSSIYIWFQEDFGDEAAILAHLRRYAEPALAARLAGVDGIVGHDYDWAVNVLNRPERGS